VLQQKWLTSHMCHMRFHCIFKKKVREVESVLVLAEEGGKKKKKKKEVDDRRKKDKRAQLLSSGIAQMGEKREESTKTGKEFSSKTLGSVRDLVVVAKTSGLLIDAVLWIFESTVLGAICCFICFTIT